MIRKTNNKTDIVYGYRNPYTNKSYVKTIYTAENERKMLLESCEFVLSDTKWVLKNLDRINSFQVRTTNVFPTKIINSELYKYPEYEELWKYSDKFINRYLK